MRTIAAVTVSRADYWILKPVLKKIQGHRNLKLQVYACGSHLSRKLGYTVKQIEKDGFKVTAKVPTVVSSDKAVSVAQSIAAGVAGFAKAYAKNKPDILLLVGDRFETISAALAAVPLKLPIAHVHGGEVTEGAWDEVFRHSISKMSHLHFVSNSLHGTRLRQMGEENWRITVSGAPALDHLKGLKVEADSVSKKFNFRPGKRKILVTYHPVTLEGNPEENIDRLCQVLEDFSDADIVFTYPNVDAGHQTILRRIQSFCASRGNAACHAALGSDYFPLLKTVDVMVGNSSSGLIEAPHFKLPVVNIGNRQKGRLRAVNVIDCGDEVSDIRAALRKALSEGFRNSLKGMSNPYGDGEASSYIVEKLASIALDNRLLMKKFVDIKMPQ